ncbi:MAG TPA: NAD-dependent epimerase/dehydratase family protein [Chitinophagaceae bacterium]
MLTVAVTGAGGFVGQRFMEYKAARYHLKPVSLRTAKVGSIDLSGVDVIVHLAGKAHDMKLTDEKVYVDINYGLTKDIALYAINAGVRHFIYVSSVKVYGEGSDEPLNENSVCKPEDPYGRSKLKAEQYLLSIRQPGFTVSIVRPPVVYGPGVKGNIIRLLEAIDKGSMLPLGNTGNLRSMVFLDNLIELIHRIIDKRAPGIFVAGDERPLSTSELITLIAGKLEKRIRLITVPGFMRAMIKLIKPGLYKRLFGSFVVDNRQTNEQLEFVPPYSSEFGIGEMVNWYTSGNRTRI